MISYFDGKIMFSHIISPLTNSSFICNTKAFKVFSEIKIFFPNYFNIKI